MNLELKHTNKKVFYNFDEEYYTKAKRWAQTNPSELRKTLDDIGGMIFPHIEQKIRDVLRTSGKEDIELDEVEVTGLKLKHDNSLQPGLGLNSGVLNIFLPITSARRFNEIRLEHRMYDMEKDTSSGKYPLTQGVWVNCLGNNSVFELYEDIIKRFNTIFKDVAPVNLRLPTQYRKIIC